MDTIKRGFAFPIPLRFNSQTLWCTVVLGVVGFVLLYPLSLLLRNSFLVARPNQELAFGLANWVTALTEPGMVAAILNTARLTLVLQLISFPVAILIVWLLARTDLPGKDWIDFFFWIAFFAPSLPITLGWILLLDPDFGLVNQALAGFLSLEQGPFNIYSFWGIVWVHLATRSVVVKVILLTPFLRNIDSSFEEASRVSGVGPLRTIVRVVVPLLTPAVLVVLLMSVIHLLESFEIEQVLGPPSQFYVYSTMIYRLLQFEPPEYGAATALAVMILVVMTPLILFQQRISRSRRYTTVSGHFQVRRFSLGVWKWPAFAAVLGTGLFFTVFPLVFLGLATFMRLFGFFNLPDPWTMDHWQRVLSDSIFFQSLGNTFLLAVGTVVLAMICFPLIAYITVRTRFRGRHILDFLSWLPVAIPGLILGLGFLWLFLGTPVLRPLYGSIVVLILAAGISTMTLGVQLVKTNLLQLGQELEEASWVAGGSWLYTVRRVILPVLTPVLVTVGLVAFISAARNIAGIALLVTNQNRPLAMLQLDYMVDGRYEAAAVVGIIVLLLTTGMALLARLVGLRISIRA